MSTPVDPDPDVKEPASEPKPKRRGRKERLKDIEKLLEPYRVTDGKGFRLSDIDPRNTRMVKKEEASRYLAEGVRRLALDQDKLYAQDQWGVLLLFQAMDAAGKDGAIRHVMSGVNPQGCQVYSFKAPSSEEMDHDFLWRTSKSPPRAGPHRHLQPLLLRGSPRGARARPDPAQPEAAPEADQQAHLGTSGTRTSRPSSATSPARAT